MNSHIHVINALLDNGGDVNKLTDEGVSSLAACYVLLYPPSLFRLRDTTSKLNTRTSSAKEKPEKPTDKKSLTDAESNRIKELKQEYQKVNQSGNTDGTDYIGINEFEQSERVMGKLVVRRAERSNVEELISSYKVSLEFLYVCFYTLIIKFVLVRLNKVVYINV